jgi:hypothetical protein
MIEDSRALDLDHVGCRRDHYYDLIEHFAQAEQLAKEVEDPQMDKIALDCGRLVELMKRLLFREIDFVVERHLDSETRWLYAVNIQGGRGTPLKEPYVSQQ